MEGSRISESPELQARFGVEGGLEVGPIHLVHLSERIEIDGDLFGRMLLQQELDGCLEFLVVHGFREVIDGASSNDAVGRGPGHFNVRPREGEGHLDQAVAALLNRNRLLSEPRIE